MKIYKGNLRIDGDLGKPTLLQTAKIAIPYYPPRTEAQSYENTIVSVLKKIETTESGQYLIEEINRNSHTITIIPDPQKQKWNASANLNYLGENISDKDLQARREMATSLGMPIYENGIEISKGLGKGTNAYVWYNKTEPGEKGHIGVGYSQLLYHELVHAVKAQQGKVDKMEMDDDFDDFEEFCAILATNIYSSEKNFLLRKDHRDSASPLTMSESDFFKKYEYELIWFQRDLPTFVNNLAKVKCKFNPFRLLVASKKS